MTVTIDTNIHIEARLPDNGAVVVLDGTVNGKEFHITGADRPKNLSVADGIELAAAINYMVQKLTGLAPVRETT